MANIEDYNAKIEAIRAIPDDKTLEPAMPVDTYLQEGENLSKWSIMDADALATIGITLEAVFSWLLLFFRKVVVDLLDGLWRASRDDAGIQRMVQVAFFPVLETC